MPKQKCGQIEVTVYLFFVIHQFQKPKWALQSFFCLACAQDHDIWKAPVYFEDIQSREALQIFDKACEGFKVESLPVEICQDMLKNSSYQTKIAHTEAASTAMHVLVFTPSY